MECCGPLRGLRSGGTLVKIEVEQERPYLAALSGKDRAYKAGWLKSGGAGRESEGFVVPQEACNTTRRRGRDPALIESECGGKCEGMPVTAKTPIDRVRQLQIHQLLDVPAERSRTRRFHALYDRIHRSDVHGKQWKRVRSNKGAAGVDGSTLRSIEEQGVTRFLEGIQADLKGRPISSFTGEKATMDTESRWEAAATGDTDGPGPGDPNGGEVGPIEPIFEADFQPCA